jgi:hypothetical protein
MGTFAEPKGGDAEHTPRLPLPATRRAEILEALRRGERLTTADALRRGWGWRLAADIHRLRRYGWPVMSVLIGQGQGRNPIARYWMGAGVTP